MTETTCGLCDTLTKRGPNSLAVGYAVTTEGWRGLPGGIKICYDCAADLEKADMKDTGRATLYDCDTELTNWPGSLRFKVYHRSTGRHNWGLVRHDVWFSGPGASSWWGYRIGDNTQLTHCRRVHSSKVMS